MSARLSRGRRAALYELVDNEVLTEEQARAVLTALEERKDAVAGRRRLLWEVAGYLGGVLILGGSLLLAESAWDSLNTTTRAGVLALAALLLACAGTVIGVTHGMRSLAASPGARGRIVSVLYALCSITGATAVGIAVPDVHEMFPPMATGMVLALAGYLAMPAVPGMLAMAAFSALTVRSVGEQLFGGPPESYADQPVFGSSGAIAVGLLCVGALWCVLALRGVLASRPVGLAAGVVITLIGAHWSIMGPDRWWAHVVSFLVAVVFLACFLHLRDVVFLTGALIGVLLAVYRVIPDLFAGTVEASLLVVALGAVLLAVGAVGLSRMTRAER